MTDPDGLVLIHHFAPGLGEQLAEQVSLEAGIGESVMRKLLSFEKARGEIEHGGLLPRAADETHIKSLDIDGAVAERILPQVFEEVVVDERPIVGGVESHHEGSLTGRRGAPDPI